MALFDYNIRKENMAFDLMQFLGLQSKGADVSGSPDYASMYRSLIDPRVSEYTGILGDFGKSLLEEGKTYEAMTPAQQSMIYGRIKEQLQPDFDRQMKEYEQNVFTQGIEGTPGSAILGKLRQDYMKDLSGRATDIAIENIGLTEQGKQYRYGAGTDILGQLRSSLMGEASGIAGTQYAGARSDLDWQRSMDLYNQEKDDALWSGIGSLLGNVGSSYISDAISPRTKTYDKILAELIGKDKKNG